MWVLFSNAKIPSVGCIPCFLAHHTCPWRLEEWGIEIWPTIIRGELLDKLCTQRDARAAGRSSGKGKKVAEPSKKKPVGKNKSLPSKKESKRPRILSSNDESSDVAVGKESGNAEAGSSKAKIVAARKPDDVDAIYFKDLSGFEADVREAASDPVSAAGLRVRLLSQKAREESDMSFARETFSLRTTFLDFLVGELDCKATKFEQALEAEIGEVEMEPEDADELGVEEELGEGDEEEAAQGSDGSVVA